jgi:hypothetical protein
MTKKGLERGLVAFLFVMVFVVFSFAERDSKKIERLYTTAQLLKKTAQHPSDVATQQAPKIYR